jgi:tripartite-type tricarboxylate transporter receptor subunit TctC
MKVRNYRRKVLSCMGLAVSFLHVAQEVHAEADFYKGKTIKLVAATQPGGTSDRRIRAMLPFLEKYIPGNPTIVVEYMPGGGDRKAANYLSSTARPDGLTIGGLGGGFVSNAIVGQAGVMYDIDRFIYLGSGFSRFSAVFVTRRDAGLDSLEKLRIASGVKIGADSVGHHHYIVGRLFASIFGLKDPRFVTGYSTEAISARGIGRHIYCYAMDRATIGISSVLLEDWNKKSLLRMHCEYEKSGDWTIAKLPERLVQWYQIESLSESDYRLVPEPDKMRLRLDLRPLIKRQALAD